MKARMPAGFGRPDMNSLMRQAQKSITIKPEAVDPDDIEMLEDLVAAAVNATVKQVDETAEAEMGKLTGGLNIPGL